VLGYTGALLGFFGRFFACKFMLDDRAHTLEMINRTLDMRKIQHWDPYKDYPAYRKELPPPEHVIKG